MDPETVIPPSEEIVNMPPEVPTQAEEVATPEVAPVETTETPVA